MIGHLGPTRVPHIVDIAVAAVDVATAGDFNEDCIYLDHLLAPARAAVSGNGYGGYAFCYRRERSSPLPFALLRSA